MSVYRILQWTTIGLGLVISLWACQPDVAFFKSGTPALCEENADCGNENLRCRRGICIPKQLIGGPPPERRTETRPQGRERIRPQERPPRREPSRPEPIPESQLLDQIARFEPTMPDPQVGDAAVFEPSTPDLGQPDLGQPDQGRPDPGTPDKVVDSDPCGNGRCETGKGENCSTCPSDCTCAAKEACNTAGQCIPYCGNGACEPAQGENCSTCAKDCGCPSNKRCSQGVCRCAPQCQNKSCGSDGCGGSCGTCSSRSSCQNNRCVCNNRCSQKGLTRCDGKQNYETCLEDAQGCLYWSQSQACPSQRACSNDQCCQPQCNNKECGSDGCGGSCGQCKHGCNKDKCTRRLFYGELYIPCGLRNCSDPFALGRGKRPDIYIHVTYGDGKQRTSGLSNNVCDRTIRYNFALLKSVTELSKVKIEVRDDDSGGFFGPLHGVCHSWTLNLTKAQKYNLVDKNKKNIRLTLEVTR